MDTTNRPPASGRAAEPGSPVTKALDLLFELWTGALDRADLERLTGSCGRTLDRYIARINRASRRGPIIERSGRRYSIARTPQMADLLGGSLDEHAVAAIASTPLGGLLRGRGGLPRAALDRVRPLLDVGRGAEPDPVLATLFDAMLNARYVRYAYDSGAGPKEHLGVPVRLYLDPVQPYLVAWDEDRGHLICLATSKLSALRPEPSRRMEPARFRELGDWCRSAWGKMIRHDERKRSLAVFEAIPAVAPYFRKYPLRADQTVEPLPGGSIRVTVKIHNPKEFVRYILRFGEAVRVLGDPNVLAELDRFLGDMTDFYSHESSAQVEATNQVHNKGEA